MRLPQLTRRALALLTGGLCAACILLASAPVAGAAALRGGGVQAVALPSRLTFYWQLQGKIVNGREAQAYDVDGFETPSGEVERLHKEGHLAICYIDVGTAEEWRPDYKEFPASVLGKGDGWPHERWIDIRALAIVEPIMQARFEMCATKGFNAVEPDNMEAYANESGFPITAAEQLTYNEWVAETVHSLGMAVLQKNDPEQTPELEPYFDGALTERCNQYQECASFDPYLRAGKPVIDAEYKLRTSRFCAADEAAGIVGARFNLQLNGKRFEPCWASSKGAGAVHAEAPPARRRLARAASTLAYSHASARVIQRQPAPGSCHARGSGLYELPDPGCTPGALNPEVTQSDIDSTICSRGWTATVRPAEAVSEPEKYASMSAYGLRGDAGAYEYDHLVPLELGGAVNDPRNLWPEPDYPTAEGYYLNPKDRLESALNRLVCDRELSLARAQQMIAGDWVAAYRTYG